MGLARIVGSVLGDCEKDILIISSKKSLSTKGHCNWDVAIVIQVQSILHHSIAQLLCS